MSIGRIVKTAEQRDREEWYSDGDQHRRIVWSVYYPADPAWEAERASRFLELFEPNLDGAQQLLLEIGYDAELLKGFETGVYNHAPIDFSKHSLPVVLFSPGIGVDRDQYLYLVRSLVSAGYVVCTIGPVYDTIFTVFPGGEVIRQHERISTAAIQDFDLYRQFLTVRVQDVLFVLDELNRLNLEHSQLAGRLDLQRIGAVGHSLGGAAMLEAMMQDDRLGAGVLLDPSLHLLSVGEKLAAGQQLATPCLLFRQHNSSLPLMTNAGMNPHLLQPTLQNQRQLWEYLSGTKSFVKLQDALHMSFTEVGYLFADSSAFHKGMPLEAAHQTIGSCVTSFFNEFLCDQAHAYTDMLKSAEQLGLHEIDEDGELLTNAIRS